MKYRSIFSIIDTWIGQLNITMYIAKYTIEKTDYILAKLLTKYIQQAFTDSSRLFTLCVQRVRANLHTDDEEMV